MKVGIIGRAASGRSTLFEALTGQQPAAGQRARLRLGVAVVRDPRIDRLTEICRPKKTIYAEIGLAQPPGALDLAPLREMRELRAYVHVIGAFDGTKPVAEAVVEQVGELNTEMVLTDMERAEVRLARFAKGATERPGEKEMLERAAALLGSERALRLGSWNEAEQKLLDELGLLSHRQLLTVINVAEDQAAGAPDGAITEAIATVGSEALWLSASLELEISTLDDESRGEFLAEYGLAEPISARFAQACLALLDQICFFTIGPDEVRAWPVERGSNARRAARAVHTDLEKGFIRAEVIDYETFITHGSEAKCRTAGQQRVEGKDYEVKDGDILNIRFNI